ncbi:hypothetical protein E2C01_032919 [Portunus trituberculatus]|uniref:Uncharacterized protein n=1 Tax=Portunus trituberculatus TaxID=210409 RepID=A0A5B7F491_PORTR|nr:hypothetical protein [Portunus trituberculatus]
MADSDVKGSEMLEGSQTGLKRLEDMFAVMIGWMDKMVLETSVRMDKMEQKTSKIMRQARFEMRQEYRAALVRQDLTEEVKEELVAGKQQCEGRTGVAESVVDSRLCPEVVDTGAAKTVVGEEVVVVQDLHVADQQLCGMTGHCTTPRGPLMCTITVGGVEEELPAFVADMEEPCLVGLDSLVQSAACVDSRSMQMQV